MSIRKIQGSAYHLNPQQSFTGQSYIGQRSARESLHLLWASYPESRGTQDEPSGERDSETAERAVLGQSLVVQRDRRELALRRSWIP